ncbi:hypothetical protein Poli38472_007294 [Pythium oligandrum]|uniref:Heme haloperoxidase family profile domain-containing protein n=1 Tax=Pythium oligandrum TaxID=41045 RepID=A0A8K1C9W7_PYTOL|nr:hypothetical protein Poli38472_007294 [Pythium oligandrum]|eukprot:TMW59149.1 hypothetical protein Poli38472_007294 [Pythium oligandrum]
MVSISVYAFASVFATVIFASSTGATLLCDAELPVGEYYRPCGDKVSGRFDAKTPFRRSPCPGINTLANHGYINRDGKNITRAQLKQAVMIHYKAEDAAAEAFLGPLPDVFDLNMFTSHNKQEHDASLVHTDLYLGENPSEFNRDLLEDVFRRADNNGNFGVQQLGELRKDRLATCLAQNPNCTFEEHQSTLAGGEAALILTGFGNVATSTVDKDTLRSFLEFERFPSDYARPEVLTLNGVVATARKVTAIATQVTA